MSLVATARPTFAVDVARQRATEARALLAELGATVVGPSGLVATPADTAAAADSLDLTADLLCHLCATFADATAALRLYPGLDRPLLLWALREPGPVGDRLWLNSLCGANLVGHALSLAGIEVRLLYGDPSEPHVRLGLRRALAGELPPAPALPPVGLAGADQLGSGPAGSGPASSGRPVPDPVDPTRAATVRRALASLRGARIGVVGDAPDGFTPSAYDPALLEQLLGIGVERLELAAVLDASRTVPAGELDAERRSLRSQRPSVAALDSAAVTLTAAVTTVLRGWAARGDLAAVAVRCWPELPTELGVCPCTALSRLADEGLHTACERDVYGAATMLLLDALGAGPSYLVDTVEVDPVADLVRFWHCGSAATTLAADPGAATQDVHCNRRIGIAGNFALRTGPVVVARLAEDPANPGRLRLLLAAGESVAEPNRFMGNTAAVRLTGRTAAGAFVETLVTAGFPHHTVLAWRDVRPLLREAARQLSVPVVEL